MDDRKLATELKELRGDGNVRPANRFARVGKGFLVHVCCLGKTHFAYFAIGADFQQLRSCHQ
jgi:hypothetical protein